MSTPLLYTENQRFSRTWIWVLIIIINTFLLISYFIIRLRTDSSYESVTGLFISVIAVALITLFLQRLQLITEIRSDGIYVRFTMLHRQFQVFKWGDISRAYIRNYSSLAEYGGWGLRYGLGNKIAYNTSGNIGIQLVLKNGRTVLIGTQHPDEVKRVLQQLGFGFT